MGSLRGTGEASDTLVTDGILAPALETRLVLHVFDGFIIPVLKVPRGNTRSKTQLNGSEEVNQRGVALSQVQPMLYSTCLEG